MKPFALKHISLAILAGTSLVAQAQEESVQLNDVIVTATRLPQKTLTSLNDISVITANDIAKSGVQDLPSLLKRITGLEVSSDGGPGAVTSLYTRGTNFNQTVVLVDGIRIANANFNQASFNHIPLSQIERIEVVRGAASSVYGADAVGGVVQIFTKKAEDGAFNANIGAGIGNRNTYEVDGNVSGTVGKLSYQLSASHNQTKGFSAQNEQGFSYNPDKDGYQNSAFSGSLTYDIAEGHKIIAKALVNKGKAEYDGVSYTAEDSGQDYNISRLRIYSLESQNKLNDFITSSLQIATSEDRLNATSDNKNGWKGYINSKNNQVTWTLNGKHQYINWIAGAEWQKQKIDSDTSYNESSRTNKAIFAGLDFNKDQFLLESSLRHDNNEKFGNETTGRLATGYRITDNLTARLSYGTSFRSPTFNDLYYPGFSNPNLKAEKGKNTEIGLTYDDKTTLVQFSIFQNRIRDLINNATNINKAEITGTSLSAKHIMGDITLRGDITYQNPRNKTNDKQLDKRAKVFGNLGIDYQATEQLILSANQHLHGHSHEDVYLKGRQRLGGYGITSVSAQYQITPDWQVSVSGENIFNKHYTTAYGYNTPGASVMLKTRFYF